MKTFPLLASLSLLLASHARPPVTSLELQSGVDTSGAATPEWKRAVEEHEGSTLTWTTRPFTAEERAWQDTIRGRLAEWEQRIPALMVPFEGQRPIQTIRIVCGDQNGEDAFGVGGETIDLDLSTFTRLYGAAGAPGNRQRLDRIFAHECTHVLQTRWEATHPFPVSTPYDRALRQLWREGFGNLYSLSDEWVTPGGDPTPQARRALAGLEPIFVDRLRRLSTAPDSEESALRSGLSSGALAQKWGALPVALWLAEEAKGDGRRLRRWIQAGSEGILDLARAHLPPELAAQLPPRRAVTGRGRLQGTGGNER